MRIPRTLALGATLLVAIVAACSSGGGSSPAPTAAGATTAPASAAPSSGGSSAAKPTVKIGSDGFYEAKLMAEIYAQALEANGYTVNRDGIGIGARAVSQPALESGQFDLKPEYIGSELATSTRRRTSPTRRPATRRRTPRPWLPFRRPAAAASRC